MSQAQDMGASSGSREPDPSCAGSGPTGFDPERFRPNDYEGKPRNMPKAERRELDALIKAVHAHMDGLTDWRLAKLMSGFMSVSPINCSWQHFGLAEMFVYEAASAIEARRAVDSEAGAVGDESAAAKPDAQGASHD